LVKLLLERETGERDEAAEGEEVILSTEGKKKGKKRRRDSAGGGGKRRKMEDRCKATKGMLETAIKAKEWGIVDYLTAKGASVLSSFHVLWRF
jgi:hypothetical protein